MLYRWLQPVSACLRMAAWAARSNILLAVGAGQGRVLGHCPCNMCYMLGTQYSRRILPGGLSMSVWGCHRHVAACHVLVQIRMLGHVRLCLPLPSDVHQWWQQNAAAGGGVLLPALCRCRTACRPLLCCKPWPCVQQTPCMSHLHVSHNERWRRMACRLRHAHTDRHAPGPHAVPHACCRPPTCWSQTCSGSSWCCGTTMPGTSLARSSCR